ncbi:hypothetical protein LCGC14_0079640 [marine sediment metagenome]|uniref:DUF306 domain-containing protein n=1 Tax=marine sediment metagenome TaxID=412755 RepID=A0A0F9YKK1_9ZZZZ|nr:META domain-containing protein [Maribacter sp.]HDZ04558.1 META domain-containing protein [Maribacter sp.]HEA80848.1 META domain-containing protein [Maribacter sp.]
MKIIRRTSAFCFLFLCLSCLGEINQQSPQSNIKTISNSVVSKQETVHKKEINNPNGIYFKASGTEPFWSLELSEKQLKLKTITDSVFTPSAKPSQAMDSNVKRYKIQTESGQLDIQITQSECTNAMSGKLSPYTVYVTYKKNSETSMHKLEGCGNYITDYRLHDIWVLEKLDGNEVTIENFKKDLPSIEINAASNSFTGYAGCNQINGKLFFEKGLLRFTDIATTKMLCDPKNKETTFLEALRSVTTYKIENNRLWLSNPSDKELLIFKKID